MKTKEIIYWSLTGLTAIFIALKGLGYINWSLWLIFLPILIPLGILTSIFIIIGTMSLINDRKAHRLEKKLKKEENEQTKET